MRLTPTPLAGAFVIELEPIVDERGWFARSWSRTEFQKFGLKADIVECDVSFNQKKGTLRGMHFQTPPSEETKIVRCTRGMIHDVIVDLRRDSPTFKQWFDIELRPDSPTLLYIPEGFAHGYQTLLDESEVFYQMTEVYQPGCASGVRFNDPAFQIRWPLEVTCISAKDIGWKTFQ